MTRAGDDIGLDRLIHADQLAGVRRSLAITIPVNVLLSVATFSVAIHHGRGDVAGIWLAAVTLVNMMRIAQCWAGWPSRHANSVMSQLRCAAALSTLSGLAWACTPLLWSHPGSPDAAFHLIVGAGITGGSIALGFAYAPIAVGFVTPILVANAIALYLSDTVESNFLAATVALYLAALFRSAGHNQAIFRKTAKLKYEATTLARFLRESHAETVSVAEEMTYRARHDSLTGLMNRAGFLQDLEDRTRPPARICCLMLLDLDGFKTFNDAFGHKTGDQVLVEVAARIRSIAPTEAAAARLGGDEFAIAFDPEAVALSPAALAERIIATIGAPFGPFEAGRLGVGIGIYEGPPASTEDLLVFADEALYAAKSSGRNQYYAFDAVLRQRREMRRDSEVELPGALDAELLEIWYQPIFADGGRRLAGVEGLLRWQHHKHGWISPEEIIPAAALGGHSERLFGFVVDQACAMAQRLREAGQSDVVVAINVSPREMSKLPVDALVLDRVRAAGLPASALEIEITEQTAIDIHAVEGKLAALSQAGIRIAIDDFGVGYSSLAILRQLHADRIKIDRCFVTGLAASSENRLLLQAVVSLGRAMGLEVVAEGVETAEDVVTLRALGCQLMQGYYLGRPMRPETLLASLSCDAPNDVVTAA